MSAVQKENLVDLGSRVLIRFSFVTELFCIDSCMSDVIQSFPCRGKPAWTGK